MTMASSGVLPVRSPMPSRVQLTAEQPYSQAVRGVDQHLVEVVVAVPFEQLAGHAGVVHQTVDDAWHAAGQRHAG